jgi:hypothetical protein
MATLPNSKTRYLILRQIKIILEADHLEKVDLDDKISSSFESLGDIDMLITSKIVQQCIEPLRNVMNLPGQFRRSKEAPSSPSFFILLVFQPLDALNSVSLDQLVLQSWKLKILEQVKESFILSYKKMLSSVKQIEESFRRFKKKSDNNDDEFLKAQLDLDVQCFNQKVKTAN